MTDFLASGRAVDAILALIVVEWLIVSVIGFRTGRAIAPFDFALNLLSGVFLLLALRAALVGAGEVWIVANLLAAFVAHLLDLGRRWPRRS